MIGVMLASFCFALLAEVLQYCWRLYIKMKGIWYPVLAVEAHVSRADDRKLAYITYNA